VLEMTAGTERALRENNLGAMLRCFMAMERWSMRKLAPEIGISAATLHRLCSGYAMDADTLLKVINWMWRTRS
jgi:DNA-binding Xre family transcriptional regulator